MAGRNDPQRRQDTSAGRMLPQKEENCQYELLVVRFEIRCESGQEKRTAPLLHSIGIIKAYSGVTDGSAERIPHTSYKVK